ncbi:hypothetical protein FOZ63_004161 [Perkinsus olseni]|uniref:Uncharacterized protein n=1 Tax=Perkinsus olseni TaxID=32597 RepID=A0A7J6N663_PEROL|nr:hypothetical protein FOZ63_004161 [Perkinsus olseni]KAF4682218.1 hypothetical protein FOZ60_010831 [Perkinsus olseni]
MITMMAIMTMWQRMKFGNRRRLRFAAMRAPRYYGGVGGKLVCGINGAPVWRPEILAACLNDSTGGEESEEEEEGGSGGDEQGEPAADNNVNDGSTEMHGNTASGSASGNAGCSNGGGDDDDDGSDDDTSRDGHKQRKDKGGTGDSEEEGSDGEDDGELSEHANGDSKRAEPSDRDGDKKVFCPSEEQEQSAAPDQDQENLRSTTVPTTTPSELSFPWEKRLAPTARTMTVMVKVMAAVAPGVSKENGRVVQATVRKRIPRRNLMTTARMTMILVYCGWARLLLEGVNNIYPLYGMKNLHSMAKFRIILLRETQDSYSILVGCQNFRY